MLVIVWTGMQTAHAGGDEPAVIPRPVEMIVGEGSFTISPSTWVIATGDAAAEAQKLIDALAPAMGYRLTLHAELHRQVDFIHLRLEANTHQKLGNEGYKLKVSKQGIDLIAAKPAGLFYGIQTLRQLLPPAVFRSAPVAGVEWTVPAVHITDYPRFQWRGLLLDPARHFLPKADVLRMIDVMAIYKLNSLQLHLTDDQGWRIEIKKYPKLTEVGAWRDETLIGHLSSSPHRFDGRRHGGYYTQADAREIVAYATERHINVVPEIEMPGHFRAAIASYPWLGVFPEKQKDLKPWTRWGISTDILAPRPEGVQFCKDVLSEVMDLFPSKFIHIGGDEAKKDQWKQSEEIQKMIRDLGLKNEAELQSWFIKQIDVFLTEHDRRLIGWDEILEGGLAPGATVMSWRGTAGGIAAAEAGHDVVMAPYSHTYFDYYQGPPENEPLAIGGMLPLRQVYSFEPIPQQLNEQQAKRIL
ncbi:MAG: beta-N-acetylhexosaminidase, partial [Rhodospirillales bacterium]|nr:beta-N-acetylhexosaminidase [Rhodospirillales bacterium]